MVDSELSRRSLYIRVPGGFGDNLMASAVIARIHVEYPDMRIFVCTKRREIFRNNPHVAAIYNTRTLLKHNMSIYNRCCTFEYATYDRIREEKSQKHLIDYFYDCLPFDIRTRNYTPEIFLTSRERCYKASRLQGISRPLIAISPYAGATTRIQNKIYPPEKWPAVVEGLKKHGFAVVQFGRRKEGPVLKGAFDFRNIGYRKSAAVLLHCDALITHVSGFMHLAAAVSVPCLTLYGGVEDPRISGYPQNPDLTVSLDCVPCWLAQPCDDPRCRELLSPERIVDSAVRFVESSVIKKLPQGNHNNFL
ncbi:MAG: glycosyltransferase family 9 protein [Planctomycetota bacterium]